MSHHEEQRHHITPTRVYVLIWLALVILTGITVGVSYLDMGQFRVFTAMLIASVKVTLVALFFMHLIHESRLYFWMILAVLITYGIFIALTFADYHYRF